MHSKEEAENAERLSANLSAAFDKRLKTLNTSEGETLTFDEIAEIYIQVNGNARQANKMSLNTRTKTGEIDDYLETRRPFGTAAQWR